MLRLSKSFLRSLADLVCKGIAQPACPTVLHITHPKAGSQWLHKILRQCAPERVITPQYEAAEFLRAPIQPGKIYPTLYVT